VPLCHKNPLATAAHCSERPESFHIIPASQPPPPLPFLYLDTFKFHAVIQKHSNMETSSTL